MAHSAGTGPSPRTAATIEQELRRARAGLTRLTPAQAVAALAAGARLVDTRPEFQRRADGEVPGAVVVERNHLEWRLDPASPARIPEAGDHDVVWIVLCDEGYSSSLAADSLHRLGLHGATDVIGGFRRWRDDGMPVARPAWPTAPRLPGPQPSAEHPSAEEPLGHRLSGLTGALQAGAGVGG